MQLDENGCYSYSIAVLPTHQGKGLGQQMAKRILDFAKQKGFSSLSAHVRVANGWSGRRASALQPQERRLVKGFWPTEGDVEFQRIRF